MTNQIGLYTMKSKLLADFMIFYQNTSSLHWNIKGDKFFKLYLKNEKLYNYLMLEFDEVAERIITLNAPLLHTLDDYKEVVNIAASKTSQTENKGFKVFSNPSKPSLFIKENFYIFLVMRGMKVPMHL